jgi:hypothetical protein
MKYSRWLNGGIFFATLIGLPLIYLNHSLERESRNKGDVAALQHAERLFSKIDRSPLIIDIHRRKVVGFQTATKPVWILLTPLGDIRTVMLPENSLEKLSPHQIEQYNRLLSMYGKDGQALNAEKGK